jgi:hypothetical protein
VGGREGARGRIRTCGLPLRRRLLYPLSYAGGMGWKRGWKPGMIGPGDKGRGQFGEIRYVSGSEDPMEVVLPMDRARLCPGS